MRRWLSVAFVGVVLGGGWVYGLHRPRSYGTGSRAVDMAFPPDGVIPPAQRLGYLNIEGHHIGSSLPYLMAGRTHGRFRLFAGAPSYRLPTYSVSGCGSPGALRSPDGRYVMFTARLGHWPALRLLDLWSGARWTFKRHACNPAWGHDGQIAYVHFLRYHPDGLAVGRQQLMVQHGVGGRPRRWAGASAFSSPIWARHDLLVSATESNGHPDSPLGDPQTDLWNLDGPGDIRRVDGPATGDGPFSSVVALNPQGTVAMLDTQNAGHGRVDDLATLLRVDSNTVLSATRLPGAQVSALAPDGYWEGNQVITTNGILYGGTTHPPAELIVLRVIDGRAHLVSAKRFSLDHYEILGQQMARAEQARFLDSSGQRLGAWFSSGGAPSRFVSCETTTSRCWGSPQRIARGALDTIASFVSNPSRP